MKIHRDKNRLYEDIVHIVCDKYFKEYTSECKTILDNKTFSIGEYRTMSSEDLVDIYDRLYKDKKINNIYISFFQRECIITYLVKPNYSSIRILDHKNDIHHIKTGFKYWNFIQSTINNEKDIINFEDEYLKFKLINSK